MESLRINCEIGYTHRFNARHRVWGHLFQGRYKALPVDQGEYFRTVADYIHLNPARAHAFDLESGNLTDFKWSSFCGYNGIENIHEFEFDPKKSAANKNKHGIDFMEAQALREGPDLLEIPVWTEDEPRFLVVGKLNGKHWSGVITCRADNIRIISVRRSRKLRCGQAVLPGGWFFRRSSFSRVLCFLWFKKSYSLPL